MKDVPLLLRLINGYAAEGIMLPRTEFELAENLRDFTVVEAGGEVAGCGALHFYTPSAGEIRSLAVAREFRKYGAGRHLVEALEAEARSYGLREVFAFTYIPHFFQKLGYTEIDRGGLPLKAWKDCLRCPKFQCCDEIAVIKHLSAAEMGVVNTLICGDPLAAPITSAEPVLLPVLRDSR